MAKIVKITWGVAAAGVILLVALAAVQNGLINGHGSAPIVGGLIGFLSRLASEIGKTVGWGELAREYRSSEGPVYHNPTTDPAWPYWWWTVAGWVVVAGIALGIVHFVHFVYVGILGKGRSGHGHGDDHFRYDHISQMYPYPRLSPTAPAAPLATAGGHGGRWTINWRKAFSWVAGAIVVLVISNYALQPVIEHQQARIYGNRDAHKATVQDCSGEDYIQEDAKHALVCLNVWLATRDDSNAQLAAAEMERRLAGACGLFDTFGDTDQKTVAGQMKDNGVPCSTTASAIATATATGAVSKPVSAFQQQEQRFGVPNAWWLLGLYALMSGLVTYAYSSKRARNHRPLGWKAKLWVFSGIIVFCILVQMWVW